MVEWLTPICTNKREQILCLVWTLMKAMVQDKVTLYRREAHGWSVAATDYTDCYNIWKLIHSVISQQSSAIPKWWYWASCSIIISLAGYLTTSIVLTKTGNLESVESSMIIVTHPYTNWMCHSTAIWRDAKIATSGLWFDRSHCFCWNQMIIWLALLENSVQQNYYFIMVIFLSLF